MTSPPPEGVALAGELRDLRARTGLSLAALAGRTPYSKSSWERYLNGKKQVPRQAVEALCALAGEPAGRLLVLWELADAEWSGRARYASPTAPPAAPADAADAGRGDGPRAPGRSWRWHPSVAGAALAAMTAVAFTVLSLSGGAEPQSPAEPPPSVSGTPVACREKGCDGKDPETMFCALPGRVDAIGPERRTGTGTRLEIRYSAPCAAGWGRIWHSEAGDTIEISAPGARPRTVTVKNEKEAAAYLFTPMIGGVEPDGLRLCFRSAAGERRECFRP
ncbi:helix-turn-helix domain-containing protein [Streptomyces sp. MAR4 CNX-425]|uniref:helix-turn-helix domain-containing protein n=1 Tax=Streptomyces sp. MAR4 CNX-425 TaxID=3406343 RepID=UPI003B5141A2